MSMTRLDYIASRLQNVRRAGDGTLSARCPACAAEGGDTTNGGGHLKVWPSGAFNCAKAGGDDKDHNRQIRASLYPDDDAAQQAALLSDVEYIDPDPRVDSPTIYPDSMLARLVHDYSYWRGRGIDDNTCARFEGGLAPIDEKSKLSGRFIFPIRDDQRRIVGFSGRLVLPNSFAPSWKHLFKSSKVCWPWYLNGDAIRARGSVVLLESIGNGLSLSQVGIHNWLVLFGLQFNSVVLGHLASVNPRQIIISTDNDSLGKASSREAGNRAARKVQAQLSSFFPEERVVIRQCQTRKDWNLVLIENPEELTLFKAELDGVATPAAPPTP